jgi:hypothetical protein
MHTNRFADDVEEVLARSEHQKSHLYK